MKYIINSGEASINFDRYHEYISKHLHLFPEKLRDIASNPIYYDLQSPESLHDARLEQLTFRELGADNATLFFKWKGANAIIEIQYYLSSFFMLKGKQEANFTGAFFGDLYTHEFRLEDTGFLHEIQMTSGSSFEIAFLDLEINYTCYD